MGYSEEEILKERLKRREFHKKLMCKFDSPLLFLKLNYFGKYKKDNLLNNIIEKMDMLVSDIFRENIQMRLFRTTAEGPNVSMLLNKVKSNVEIKKLLVQIEDKHILGQFITVDIYDNNSGEKITRSDIGVAPRLCPLCGKVLNYCMDNSKHKEDEITKLIQDKYKEFMKSFYGKTV
jgi:holo-ACP synthase CitX